MTQHLPPGVTAASFNAALSALRDIVGPDWVHVSLEDGLAGYLDHMSKNSYNKTDAPFDMDYATGLQSAVVANSLK